MEQNKDNGNIENADNSPEDEIINKPELEEPDEDIGEDGTDEAVNMQSELYDWAQALVTALVFVVLLFALVLRVIGVDGISMLPTLHDNDKVLITNLFYTPKYGDIVVLTKRSFMDQPIVKRVIATEGQTVQIDFNTSQIWIDGDELYEPYILELTTKKSDLDFSNPVTVPEGCVFVMGDNRNNSSDSRRSDIGMIDRRYILGRVLFRLYPFNSFGVVE